MSTNGTPAEVLREVERLHDAIVRGASRRRPCWRSSGALPMSDAPHTVPSPERDVFYIWEHPNGLTSMDHDMAHAP